MSKNLKTLICCILALMFVAGTVVAVFADSTGVFTKEAESVSADDVTNEPSSAEEPSSEPVQTVKLGDVNLDGKITAADARLALRHSAQLQVLTGVQFINADVIVDGTVKANDARLILRVSAQLDSESIFGGVVDPVEPSSAA